jgi:UDP-N-acetylglucosamine 2-epimerase (non-hydrolysing)
MKKILIVFGTRPEIIKLAPVINKLKPVTNLTILHTGQHRELADPLFELFDVQPDIDLEVMEKGQDLFDLSTKLLPLLKSAMAKINPDFVIVQGDTTSSYLAALSAFYLRIPVLHIEAGLRSHSIYEPFPEEMNRRQISVLASYHFAATELNKQNLLNEGVDKDRILVTGNTVVDALRSIIRHRPNMNDTFGEYTDNSKGHRSVLLTVHRRENLGEPINDILKAVEQLLDEFPELNFLMPVHPNPEIQKRISEHELINSRFKTIPPVSYDQFIRLIQHSDLILTDSGGLQEEGAALGKKIFVLRNRTERQELIDSGIGELTGTDTDQIVDRVSSFLKSGKDIKAQNIFGDGKASERIRDFIIGQL